MDRISRFTPVPAIALAALVAGAPAASAAPLIPRPDLPVAYEAPAGADALAAAQLDHWWLLFNDPGLNALEDEAFRNGPDARTAAARVLEARAVRGSDIAQTLPTGQISGKASLEHERNIGSAQGALFPIGGNFENESLNLEPSWEIDLFGRLRQARKVATATLAASRFNVEGARASLAASVADTYFQATGLGIQIVDATETVRIESGLQKAAQDKVDIGISPASDADRVAGDLAQAQAQLQDVQSQLHTAQRQLLILIGRGSAPVESLKLPDQAATAPPIPAVLPGQLLSRRPDVREAEAKLRAEAGTAKLRHLAIFPTFTILPQLGLTRSVQPSVSYNPATNALSPFQQTTSLGFWTWGGGVTVPFFDIPRLLFDASAEDARTRQAAIAYEKSVQTAYGEAENALVNLDAGKRATALLTAGEARARRASEAADQRYAMGIDDITSTLSAEQAWRTTRTALTSEQVQTLRRAVALYKALGGGWDSATAARAQ